MLTQKKKTKKKPATHGSIFFLIYIFSISIHLQIEGQKKSMVDSHYLEDEETL